MDVDTSSLPTDTILEICKKHRLIESNWSTLAVVIIALARRMVIDMSPTTNLPFHFRHSPYRKPWLSSWHNPPLLLTTNTLPHRLHPPHTRAKLRMKSRHRPLRAGRSLSQKIENRRRDGTGFTPSLPISPNDAATIHPNRHAFPCP